MDDGLGEAIRTDCKTSLITFSPHAICVALFFMMTTLPSYTEQRAIVFLFVNYILSNITLSLMMHTMTGKKFSFIQPITLLLLVPLVAYHCMGASSEMEQWLSRALTALALFYFYGRLAVISIQWCDFA